MSSLKKSSSRISTGKVDPRVNRDREKAKVQEYNRITYEELDKHLVALARGSGKSDTYSQFVAFTGDEGMFEFQLAMIYHDNPEKVNMGIHGKVHRAGFRGLKHLHQISLISKGGTWKVLLNLKNKAIPFTLMDGTKEICQTDSTDSLNDAIMKYVHKN